MGLHDAGKSTYLAGKRRLARNPIRDYVWLLEQEVNTWKHWTSLPVGRRVFLLRHGFTSPYGKLYDLDAHGAEAFLSELQRYRFYRSINGDHRYLLDDKLSQHWMLAPHASNRPKAFGFLNAGRIHGVAGTEYSGDPVPVREWFPQALREESRLVCKHVRGKGGKEVVVCEWDGAFALDGERVTEQQLCDEIATLTGYLVTEHVTQHAYADDLYPDSSNTIRVLTLWDEKREDLHVPIAVHRIGTERSRPLDNFSAGGLTAEIDLETGRLGPAAQYPYDGEVPRYVVHPDTGAQIEGATVPNMRSVVETVEQMALENTNIPALGWDVLLDEDGVPIVIEANTGCGMDLFQVHRPLLEDDWVARIVSRHLPEVEAPEASETIERSQRPESAAIGNGPGSHTDSAAPTDSVTGTTSAGTNGPRAGTRSRNGNASPDSHDPNGQGPHDGGTDRSATDHRSGADQDKR